ncbi:MAG: hypothetical protein ACXVQJ_09725 [Actinomycetota bacterium]
MGAPVTLTTWDRHNVGSAKSTDVATLVRIYTAPEDWEARVLRSPYWLTVRGGTVVGVSELYLP